MKNLFRILLLLPLLAVSAGAEELRSGYADASGQVRAMQDDDDSNPGMLWVLQGRDNWDKAPTTAINAQAAKSCASCHGPVTNMKGVSARYPAWDESRQQVVTLLGRINLCRQAYQGQAAFGDTHEISLSLMAVIGHQSRGLPVSVATSGPLAEVGAKGREIFNMRQGQLNLSCADCHTDLAGKNLGASKIPQGHPNGYPLYRLEGQHLGSLERRLRNCLGYVRAQAYPDDSPDLLALEVYLAQRSVGLKVETPAVRP